jgi:hypothetical protein
LRPEPFSRLDRTGLRRPGRSSVEGGIPEFPLLRPAARSRAVTRSTNRAFVATSSAITTSRDRHASQPAAGGGNGSDVLQSLHAIRRAWRERKYKGLAR